MDSSPLRGGGKPDEAAPPGRSLAHSHARFRLYLHLGSHLIRLLVPYEPHIGQFSCPGICMYESVQILSLQKQTKTLDNVLQHSARVGHRRQAPLQDRSLQPSTHVGRHTDIYPRRHMHGATRLICRHQPSVGCCQIPIETVRSYAVAYAVVPCRAGAPAAKQRNGSRTREYMTQKGDEHATERAWNGNVPLKLTRLTKRDENLEHHVGCGQGTAKLAKV